MAFAITNKNFPNPEGSYLPAAHYELADLTLATASSIVVSATQNTGIVGLKWVRFRARLKTLGGLAAGETLVVSIQAGTGAAITAPEQIAQKGTVMLTGDTFINIDGFGWSQNGFQSFAVTVNSSGNTRTSVVDVMVDCG